MASILKLPIVASGGANGEPVGRAPVLALIEVALHVPSPTEGLAARRAPVGAAVNVTVVLKRAWVFEDLAALVASVPAHAVWCDGEGLGHRVCKKRILFTRSAKLGGKKVERAKKWEPNNKGSAKMRDRKERKRKQLEVRKVEN